jgi:hypothetical protein
MMIALAASVAGCWAAAAGAGAAAGTAAGIYYSDRGAESMVSAPFDQVVAAAERALPEMGVSVDKANANADVEENESEAKLQGKRNDGEGEVEVVVKREQGESVKVEVVAKKSEITWDKDFAGKVLERIVQYAGNGTNNMNQ